MNEFGKREYNKEKENLRTAYIQVLWNRCDPKDIPYPENLFKDDDIDAPRPIQTVDDMKDTLQTLAARGNKGGVGRGKTKKT